MNFKIDLILSLFSRCETRRCLYLRSDSGSDPNAATIIRSGDIDETNLLVLVVPFAVYFNSLTLRCLCTNGVDANADEQKPWE